MDVNVPPCGIKLFIALNGRKGKERIALIPTSRRRKFCVAPYRYTVLICTDIINEGEEEVRFDLRRPSNRVGRVLDLGPYPRT